MTDEPITWRIALKFYWLIVWRTVVMYMLAYAPFNLVYVWLLSTGRLDDSNDDIGNRLFLARLVLSTLLLAGASFIAVRMALRKRYRGFSLQVVREPVS